MTRQPSPVLLLVALMVPSSSSPLCAQTPAEQEVIAAEASLEQVRMQSKQTALARVLDDNAREVAADGNLATVVQPQVPVLASQRLGIRIYKDVAIVTSTVRLPTAEAHVLRIWVRAETAWRLLVSQQTALAPHLSQPTIRVPLARLVDEDDAESAGVQEAEYARLDARNRRDIAQYAILLGDDYAESIQRGCIEQESRKPTGKGCSKHSGRTLAVFRTAQGIDQNGGRQHIAQQQPNELRDGALFAVLVESSAASLFTARVRAGGNPRRAS